MIFRLKNFNLTLDIYFLRYCIILTMLKKNEILKTINSAAAQLSSSITLNFFQVYVYLLIIKTIIFILSSYLIKSFIYINYYLVILHTNKYYYLIPAV